MSFCEDIERESQAQREAMAFHPFVQGIGDGTLPVDRFKHFITSPAAWPWRRRKRPIWKR